MIIALTENGGSIPVGHDIYVFAEQAVDTFNNDKEGGYSDWMLPNLFDAKRFIKFVSDIGYSTYNPIWTTDAYDLTKQYTAKYDYDNSKVVVGNVDKSVATNFIAIRKQVVTA